MEITLTPQLFGTLLDEGYLYSLAKRVIDPDGLTETIHLLPVRERPVHTNYPDGYQTYYKLTQEPLQLINIPGNRRVLVDLKSGFPFFQNAEIGQQNSQVFRYNENFFEQVLHSIQDYAVFTTNLSGNINSWNSGAEHLFKYKKNEIFGVNVLKLYSNPFPEFGLRDVFAIARKDGKGLAQNFHQTKDGCKFWANEIVFPLFDEQETQIGFTKIVKNLEETKQSERQTVEAVSLANSIIEATKEPVVILNKDLNIRVASKSFYQMFHLNEHESHEKNFYSLTPGLDQQHLHELFDDILPRINKCKNFELRYDTPAGKPKMLLVHANRTLTDEGNNRLDILSIQDVTDERSLQQEKDDFISIASHELKTPVTIIKASAQILQRLTIDGASTRVLKCLQKIEEQSDKLIEMAALLLDISHARNGTLALKYEVFDITNLVSSAVEDFQILHTNYNLLFNKTPSCMVEGDKLKLNQVITNLLSNAIKYSPNSTDIMINISANQVQKMVTVSVHDFGIGIPPEEHSRIFKRFSRTMIVKEKKLAGSGLGLYISSEIIRNHDGCIWFESDPEKGTIFYFNIPLL